MKLSQAEVNFINHTGHEQQYVPCVTSIRKWVTGEKQNLVYQPHNGLPDHLQTTMGWHNEVSSHFPNSSSLILGCHHHPTSSGQQWRRELAGRKRECRQLEAGGTEGGWVLRTRLSARPGHSGYNAAAAAAQHQAADSWLGCRCHLQSWRDLAGHCCRPKPHVGTSNWFDFGMCLPLTTSILGEQASSSLPEPAPSTKTETVSVSRHRKGVQTLAAGKQNEGTRYPHRKSRQSANDR